MNRLKSLLIIDDQEVNIHTLMELLDERYDILAATEGEDGLEIVADERVDLILLDIMMPGMDGFEVCQRLKSNPDYQDIPVIFITAKSDEDSIEQAYEVGAVDYVTKPFKAREVISRIETHLSLAEQKHHLEERVKEEVDKNLQKEMQLFESAKMAAMGEMIGNIIHQWKQPLQHISSLASNLQLESVLHGTVDSTTIEEYAKNITASIQRMSETTETFRNYLKEKKVKEKIILQERIEQSLIISGTVLKDKGIELIKEIDNDNPIKITTIGYELTEVIINIVNNAIDVIEEKKIADGAVHLCASVVGDYAVITIEDNGGGIPGDVLPNIFDEYFTTKEDNRGTGLGLYMSHKIVTGSLLGELYVENSDKGARFTIKLPMD
jgi:signal transduction histidine kinase